MAVMQLSTYTGLKHSVASGVLTEIGSGAFTWPVATGQDSGQSEKRAPGTEQYIDFSAIGSSLLAFWLGFKE
jgi:hypothetical protein